MIKKLNTTVFALISDMQKHLPIIEVKGRGDFLMDACTIYRLSGTVYLRKYIGLFEKFDLKEELKPVVDATWNINREIQKYAYPEPRLFNWDFKYGVDGWDKLLSLQKEHPDQTITNISKFKVDTILNNKP
jgi:hypothetical protein